MRWHRSAGRLPAVAAVIAPAVGYLALTATTSYPMLVLISVVFLGAGMAGFPQLFALARTHLGVVDPAVARRRTPALLVCGAFAVAGAVLLLFVRPVSRSAPPSDLGSGRASVVRR